MYTAVPQKIMTDNPQLDFAIVGVFGDNEYSLWELLEELKAPGTEICRDQRTHLEKRRRNYSECPAPDDSKFRRAADAGL